MTCSRPYCTRPAEYSAVGWKRVRLCDVCALWARSAGVRIRRLRKG
jgi:hypothetical protein